MKLKQIAILAALAGAFASPAYATNLSYSGNFVYDNDVQSFTFTVGSASLVTLRSYSFAGGVNAAGQTIARGGFDPILSLFDANGLLIGEQDDAPSGTVPRDAVTGAAFDVNMAIQLAAGSYTVQIQQFDNVSNGSLAAGYLRDVVASRQFRSGFGDGFWDSHWAFDLLNVETAVVNPPSTAVPEPASLALFGAGVAGLAALRRRRRVA